MYRINEIEWHIAPTYKWMSYEDSLKYCQSLGDQWRIPTLKEWFLMFDYDSGFPCIGFGQPTNYWTSTKFGRGKPGTVFEGFHLPEDTRNWVFDTEDGILEWDDREDPNQLNACWPVKDLPLL